MRVKDVRESESPFVMSGIEVNTSPERGQTSDRSLSTKELEQDADDSQTRLSVYRSS